MRVQHLTMADGLLMTLQDGLKLVEILFTPTAPLSLSEAGSAATHIVRSLSWILRPDRRPPEWLISAPDLDQVVGVEYTMTEGRVQGITIRFE